MKLAELESILDGFSSENQIIDNTTEAICHYSKEIQNNTLTSIFHSCTLILNESLSDCILSSNHPLVKHGNVQLLLQKFIYDNASYFQITDSLDECNTHFTKFTTGLYLCTLEYYDINNCMKFNNEGDTKCQHFTQLYLQWLTQHQSFGTNDPELLLYAVLLYWSLNDYKSANKYIIDYCINIIHGLPHKDHSHARVHDQPVQVFYIQVIHTLQLLLYIGRLRISSVDKNTNTNTTNTNTTNILDDDFIRHVIHCTCLMDKYVVLLMAMVVRNLITFASLNFRYVVMSCNCVC